MTRPQAEYPNWRTQKCEQCDRGFGQMTAYYLHMVGRRAGEMDMEVEAELEVELGVEVQLEVGGELE